MRAVPEWIGRNDNVKIPDRVKVRVYHKAKGKCAVCTLTTLAGQYDHVIPLILGGEHREANLQWLCVPCHKAKTALDVKLKAKVARVQKRHLGIKKPSRFPGSRDSRWKKKMDGSVVLR
jgi:5-methylcytosine-specific restriction protein A